MKQYVQFAIFRITWLIKCVAVGYFYWNSICKNMFQCKTFFVIEIEVLILKFDVNLV